MIRGLPMASSWACTHPPSRPRAPWRFGDNLAAGIDLVVERGTVFGVLGPNGARQDHHHPDAGHAAAPRPRAGLRSATTWWLRPMPSAARSALTGSSPRWTRELTGQENLVLLGRLLSVPCRHRGPAPNAPRRVGPTEAGDRLASDYSAACAGASTSRPASWSPLLPLFLDEPTTGLGSAQSEPGWEIVRVLVGEGTTVLLTTQHLEEAWTNSPVASPSSTGRVIAEGTSNELKQQVGTGRCTSACVTRRSAPTPSGCWRTLRDGDGDRR